MCKRSFARSSIKCTENPSGGLQKSRKFATIHGIFDFFGACGMLYMSIFHGVDFFHHDFILVLMSDFRDTFILLGAPSNCEVGIWGQHRTKTRKSLPQQKEWLLKHDDLFLQREIWNMHPPLWWRFSPVAEIDAYLGKLKIADGKMHHLKVYFLWNLNKNPLIWSNYSASNDLTLKGS